MSEDQELISKLLGITNTKIISPIKIIYIDKKGKWAVSAFAFKDNGNTDNHIGIHYYDHNFTKKSWLIIPRTLEKPILDVLNLEPNDRKLIDNFLSNSNNINLINGINTVIINRV